MKTIYEKSYANQKLASEAADKELGDWAKTHAVQQMPEGKRWVVVLVKVAKPARAKKVKEAKPVDPDALTRAQFNAIAASGKCPCCECSEDAIYLGEAPEGMVKNESRIIGCHQCGWEFSFAAPKRMAEALNSARKAYVKTMSYAGNISADNNDLVAEAIRGLSPAQVCELADIVKGVKTGTYSARYAPLNIGQRRMNAGNVIRAAVKNGEFDAKALKAAVARVVPVEELAIAS